jgi:undecaprenyl-diphosphatase
MTDLHAVLLGIFQGITEFLPVSSTAHVLIVDKVVFKQDSGAAFTAVMQWGTLLATLLYFRKDILAILLGARTPADADNAETANTAGSANIAGRRLLLPILVGTIPIVIFGVLFKKQIENDLRSLYVIGASMIGFALLLGLAEARHRARRTLADVTVKDGLLVGLFQSLALIPGASRSGTTITGALFTGLDRATAARFSFLLSLPAIFAAGLKELWDYHKQIAAMDLARPLIIATVVSFVVGWYSIDWLLRFLKSHSTYGFIIYRIAVGLALVLMVYQGLIKQ